MAKHKIGCLPVLAGQRLGGIVTTTDVLDMLAEMLGVSEVGSRIEVDLPAAPGALSEVARLIEERGVRIASLVTLPRPEEGLVTLVMCVQTIHLRPIAQALQQAGYRVPSAEEVFV